MKHTNSLINARSPYLLQHAHNPVNWQVWSEEVFSQAKKENKLVLVSIGYSACHWCHVMEHECFEDEETAALMNKYFINIKVDREERPDVDHIYMTAVQLMSGHGGWPLNCFVLPDGRPVYGGTYFPKQRWVELLKNLATMYSQNKSKVEEYAQELTRGIKQVNEFSHLSAREISVITIQELQEAVSKWQKHFDKTEGGNLSAPKFPMPNNYLFLLRFAHLKKDEELLQQVHLTLEKMAYGGIYDHLGGGFARYSTDTFWKVPHFEKMLYDNAQLISLYCEGYRQTKNPLYKQVVYETIEFIEREMTSPEGGFYSALDADSEGKEGLFYIWTKEELKDILKKDFDLFADYYSVNEIGYWEDEFYILLRNTPEKEILTKHSISEKDLQEKISACKKMLMEQRGKRVRPGLDDKMIASWNGLMCKAFGEAFLTFNEQKFLSLALKNAEFMKEYFICADNSLYRCTKGKEAYGAAFLDDYAFMIDALIGLFNISGENKFLERAMQLTDYCFTHFYNEEKGLFYFSAQNGEALIAKNFEINDNVIPASNSQMAINLQSLYALTGTSCYEETAAKMLQQMQSEIKSAPSSHSNWALAALRHNFAFYEVCIVGKDVDEFRTGFAKHYHPNAIFVYSKQASEIALLKGRYKPDETLVYVCSNKTCNAPAKTMDEALEQIK
ncbi:MAG TPA: thioredoxin domain-containing protein [Bacteroidia bacterium]|jgi:uncharacterized protein YyaL (SSP411 family)|nr:thioredoxin domain-containing protein [Bacteroidia bacterium]